MPPLQNTPWHPLPLTSSIRSAPPLLLRSTFTLTSYTIHLTDLTNVWSETLSKREILHRANAEETSINPVEDPSQLQILLTKLQHAVTAQNDDIDVELTSTRSGVLKLKIITELPPPLRALAWTFNLRQLPRVQYTNLFVLPLLGSLAVLQDQNEALVAVVRDKDNVIERLADQLKEHALDVKSLLGGGRARRRGLEKFDEESWRGDYIMEGERRVGEMVKEVFGGGMKEVGGGVRGLGEVEGWWENVEDEDGSDTEKVKENAVPVRIKVEKVKEKTPVKKEKTEIEEDNEFQVQKTPPHKSAQPFPKKAPSPVPPPVDEDDRTASDSDLDLPPRKFTPSTTGRSSTTKQVSPPRSRFGRIGHKNTSTPPPPSARTSDVAMPDSPAGAAEETEDSDTVVVPRALDKGKGKKLPDGSISPPKLSGKGSVKLVIGDERSTSVPVPPAEKTASEDEQPSKEASKPAPFKKTIGRIGKIGNRKVIKNESNDDAEMKDTVVKATSTSTIAPDPEPEVKVKTLEPEPESEDEDEKADRKRRQLEKELEAKKKAPAKKKRKF